MVWSNVLLVRSHVRSNDFVIEHVNDYSRTHERTMFPNTVSRGSVGQDMTPHQRNPRIASPALVRSPSPVGPIDRPRPDGPRPGPAGSAGRVLRRPAPRGRRGSTRKLPRTGVRDVRRSSSQARAPSRDTSTVGTGLLAGVITLWLGVVAHFGQLASGRVRRCCPGARPIRRRAGANRRISLQAWPPEWRPTRPSAGRQRIRELNKLELGRAGRRADPDCPDRLTVLSAGVHVAQYDHRPSSAGDLLPCQPAADSLARRGNVQVRSGSSCDETRMSARRRSGHALSVLPTPRFAGGRLS